MNWRDNVKQNEFQSQSDYNYQQSEENPKTAEDTAQWIHIWFHESSVSETFFYSPGNYMIQTWKEEESKPKKEK